MSDPSAPRLAETHGQVLRRYAAPLRDYVGASSLRALDDAEALVDDFLASRLAQEHDLEKWRDSGLSLRRWLVSGLLLHARERLRGKREAAGACAGCACAGPCDPVAAIALEAGAFERFERAWSRALLGEACALAQRELVAEGDGDAWEIFRRTSFEGVGSIEIGRERGIAAAEIRALARRGGERLEHAMRGLLEAEGVARDDLDEEFAWLMEVSGR